MFVSLLPKPLSLSESLLLTIEPTTTIQPIDHQAYQPFSLSTIKPPINLWSSFGCFEDFSWFPLKIFGLKSSYQNTQNDFLGSCCSCTAGQCCYKGQCGCAGCTCNNCSCQGCSSKQWCQRRQQFQLYYTWKACLNIVYSFRIRALCF